MKNRNRNKSLYMILSGNYHKHFNVIFYTLYISYKILLYTIFEYGVMKDLF